MDRRMIVLVSVLLIFFVGLGAINAAYSKSVDDAGNGTEVVNESFDANHSELIGLSDSNISEAIYNDTVTVRDNTSTVVDASGNYTWNDNNGTLTITSDPPAFETDGENATITYGYRRPTDTQSLARYVSTLPMQIGEELGAGLAGAVVLFALVMLIRKVNV